MNSWANDEERRRLFEYFIVAGLSDASEAEELVPLSHECGNKIADQLAPITDICIIFPSLGETIPKGYECIQTTPSGHPADLNHGSFRTSSAFLCYKRGYHKPPLVDIGILDESKREKVRYDSIIIERTPFGNSANVNNSSSALYFTTRRSNPNAPPHQLVITHICVILTTKGETPPHTYFKIDRNLNKAMVGSAVYVCYKKSQSSSKRISYKPSVLDCYPKIANINDSIARNVPMFCLPMGAVIESWSERCGAADRIFSTCVLTDEVGTKYYGASLTFYEKYSSKLTEAQLEKLELSSLVHDDTEEDPDLQESYSTTTAEYYSNKAICIVSKYPFFEPFRKFLFFLHAVSSTPGKHRLSIERYISHLMLEVPFPTPSRPRVLVHLSEEMNTFESHDDSQVPLSGAAFLETLKHLGVENMIYVMSLTLLEQKILIHSLRPWLLTTVAETVCALMFPFYWQCPYIPQCPLDLAGVLHAPLPFICGLHSRYFDLYEDPPTDVTCFDLDTGTVSQSTVRKTLKVSVLPKKPLKKLRAALEQILVEIQRAQASERNLADFKKYKELRIREEFLRFMCSLMTGYTDYLTPISRPIEKKNATNVKELFDVEAFVKSRDRNSQEFYQRFTATQSFIRFIEERSFVSDKNVYDVFFDDCVRKIEDAIAAGNVATVGLLDKEAFVANRTIVVPTPELYRPNKENDGFEYTTFPTRFQHELFETELILQNRRLLPSLTTDYTSKKRANGDEQVYHTYILARSKQEIRTSLAEVQNFIHDFPNCWARTLLFYTYSLWFLQLPSMINLTQNKLKMLRLAFRVLGRMDYCMLPFHDQVCHRILIHQCGECGRPKMAVDVLELMSRSFLPINAITYGIYHQAVMSGRWPNEANEMAIRYWNLLRNVLDVTIRLKRFERARRANLTRYKQIFTPPPPPTPPSTKPIISTPLPLTGSPSLSSLVHQIRKHTLKGVDGVVQQSSTFLKKSGLNSIIADAKNSFRSNTSHLSRDHSITFSSMSLSEENLLDSRLDADITSGMECFQQDMGSADNMLGEQFWMRDIWPRSMAENGRGSSGDPTALNVNICSHCRCPSCNAQINDDQLMNGWTANDANLNSTCLHCSASFSPLLKISVYERQNDKSSVAFNRPHFSLTRFVVGDDDSNKSNTSKISPPDTASSYDPANLLSEISVPFLSPLVLRKELETLSCDNIHFLVDSSVRLSHPIIFWNLIYFFRRLELPTHLYTFLPNSTSSYEWPTTTFNRQSQPVETTSKTNVALINCEFVKLTL